MKASLRPSTFVDSRGRSDEMQLEKADSLRDYRFNFTLAEEFVDLPIPERGYLLKDLIAKRSITIINGNRGAGKSWLALAIANEIAWGGQVGPWKVTEPVGALFVDAEMETSIIQERIKLLNMGRNLKDAPAPLYLYLEAMAWERGLARASILDAPWREFILTTMKKNPDIGLLVLDNLASLAPGIDENDKMSFDVVNRWLLQLRFLGVSVIMVHHLGKSGEQRGTSAHEDHVDLALNIMGKAVGPCSFIAKVTKDRSCAALGKCWKMQLTDDKGHRKIFKSTEIGAFTGLVPDLGTMFSQTPTKKVEEVLKFMEAHSEASDRTIAKACHVSKNSIPAYRILFTEGQ